MQALLVWRTLKGRKAAHSDRIRHRNADDVFPEIEIEIFHHLSHSDYTICFHKSRPLYPSTFSFYFSVFRFLILFIFFILFYSFSFLYIINAWVIKIVFIFQMCVQILQMPGNGGAEMCEFIVVDSQWRLWTSAGNGMEGRLPLKMEVKFT